MRVLIAISSWVGAATNGDNQAMRETWLKDIGKYSEVDYRFFIGDGNSTGEDESDMWASFKHSHSGYREKAAASQFQRDVALSYEAHMDTVVLQNVPDDYAHLSYKVREQYRWALEHDYDYIFHIGSDVYVVLERLVNSSFENYHYLGRPCSGNAEAQANYASSGGYWISKKAMQCVIEKPITIWAEDWWVGTVLYRNGFDLCTDFRYAADYPIIPMRDNNIISSHLGIHNGLFGKYENRIMYEVHENFTS